MPEVHLGPFILLERIGHGAMGEVYKAKHRERGIPAAIKLMSPQHAMDESRRKAFFDEVRAVVRLDHPGIAWVLDYGTVDDAAAAQRPELVSGSPYLAMEYASRGTLAEIQKSYNWSELRALLLSLLDALAHAHARGVIHRDLKPANVLLCSRKDLRPGLKLCDFGIAVAMDETRDDQTVAGTLHYMAPEQLEARTREQGPWTDLYAFGCLAWRLTTGLPPFSGKRQTQLMFAQLTENPPALVTTTPLPVGFEEWLRVLMQKDPTHRFRCAADAARALLDLGHPERSMPDEDLRTGIVAPVVLTQNLLDGLDIETETATAFHVTENDLLTADPQTLMLDGPTLAWPLPPKGKPELRHTRAGLPLDWRRPARQRPTFDLLGAGLELFGLRQPTFIGRETERDHVWETLTSVHRHQRAHTLLIEGAAGVGKSHLARWAAERATEVGSAHPLHAHFSSQDDSDVALTTMLLRRFQAYGLSGSDLTTRLDQVLDELQIEHVDLRKQTHALLSKGTVQGASRYVVIRLLLEALSRERPVILVLDDLHTGLDGLRFCRHLHNAQAIRPFPILVLATLDPEQRDANDLLPEFQTLQKDKRVDSIALGRLPDETQTELVRELLGLEPELATQVVDRTAGNPLFAIQLVGDWIERDQLVLGRRGFQLAKGVRPQLPPSLKYVWVKRLARVYTGAPDGAESILERAAVLGMEVDEAEWSGSVDDPEGMRHPGDPVRLHPGHARTRAWVVQRLLALDLVDDTEAGFRFRHGQFRDAILERARAYKRLEGHHRAAANQLQFSKRDLERYGRHLLAAGQRQASLDPLLRAVPAVQSTIGRTSAWRLLDTIEHTLKKLDLPRDDMRWGRLWIERAALAELLGRHEQCVKWAAKAGSEASRHRWSTIAAQANFRLAKAAIRVGDLDMANARLVRVTNQVKPEEYPFLVGEALFLLGDLTRRMDGEPAEFQKLMKAGRTWMMKDTNPRRRVRALTYLARAAIQAGRPDQCVLLTERARKVAIDIGDLPQQVQCLSYLAEVARERGELDQAADQLHQAIEVFELIGDAQLALLRCNLAIVHLERGRSHEALAELDRALSNAVEVDRDPLRLAVQCVRLRALVEADRFDEFDEAVQSCRSLISKVPLGEKDCASSAATAGRRLAVLGEMSRAQAAFAIAKDQYTKLGDTQALQELPSSDHA